MGLLRMRGFFWTFFVTTDLQIGVHSRREPKASIRGLGDWYPLSAHVAKVGLAQARPNYTTGNLIQDALLFKQSKR